MQVEDTLLYGNYVRDKTAAGLPTIQYAKAAIFAFVLLKARAVLAILDDVRAFATFATIRFCYRAAQMHQMKVFGAKISFSQLQEWLKLVLPNTQSSPSKSQKSYF